MTQTTPHKKLTADGCNVGRAAWFGEAETVREDASRMHRALNFVNPFAVDRQEMRMFATARRARRG